MMMVERRQHSPKERHELNIENLFARVINNKKEIDTGMKNVKIDLGRIYQEQENLRSDFSYIVNNQIAADKEAENMSELVEIKTRASNIEATVNKLVTDVAVINTTIALRFDTTDKVLNEIKDTLKEMKTDSVTSKRYRVTTIITSLALIIAILACAATWVNATK